MKKTVIFLCLLCFALLLCACTQAPEGEAPPSLENGGGNQPPVGSGATHVHTMQYYPAVEPVCGAPGNIEYWECTGCYDYFADAQGDVLIGNRDSVRLLADEHVYQYTYTEVGHCVTYTCTCGLRPEAEVAHDPTQACTVCGYVPGTPGLKYALNESKTAYVVTGVGKATGDVVIAAIYNGRPVTKIADQAFASATQITSIRIPESITEIGAHAFRNCSGLTAIEIPGSVTKISESMFSYCVNLKSVTFLPAEGEEQSGITEIGEWAFRSCHSLVSVMVPPAVTNIAYHAFYDCTALESVVLPQGLTNIEANAFAGCSKLAELSLPAGVVNIGVDAFLGCDALLYEKDGLRYVGEWVVDADPSLTRVEGMREGTRGIAFGVFSGCVELVSVYIPESICYIGAEAFKNCEGLTQVVFENQSGWYAAELASEFEGAVISSEGLRNPSTAAIYLTRDYMSRFWKCN